MKIRVKGDWTNNGTFSTSTTGEVTFNSTTADQTVKPGGDSFPDLILKNTGFSINIYDNINQVEWGKLPSKFVIKSSLGAANQMVKCLHWNSKRQKYFDDLKIKDKTIEEISSIDIDLIKQRTTLKYKLKPEIIEICDDVHLGEYKLHARITRDGNKLNTNCNLISSEIL